MRILAIDPATRTGWAAGTAGSPPRSGAVRLKTPDDLPGVAAFNMLAWMRDHWFTFEQDYPDLVVAEHYLNPVGFKSADAIILQIMLHGSLQAITRSFGIRIELVHSQTIRKHFIGKANAGDRKTTKLEVLKRCKLLGYLPEDSRDEDRADACALFDYASHTYARTRPAVVHLFGER